VLKFQHLEHKNREDYKLYVILIKNTDKP